MANKPTDPQIKIKCELCGGGGGFSDDTVCDNCDDGVVSVVFDDGALCFYGDSSHSEWGTPDHAEDMAHQLECCYDAEERAKLTAWFDGNAAHCAELAANARKELRGKFATDVANRKSDTGKGCGNGSGRDCRSAERGSVMSEVIGVYCAQCCGENPPDMCRCDASDCPLAEIDNTGVYFHDIDDGILMGRNSERVIKYAMRSAWLADRNKMAVIVAIAAFCSIAT